MTDEESKAPGQPAAAEGKAPPGPPGGSAANTSASDKKNDISKLSAEEQMALFEKDLKENDWGHQPC